MAHFNIYHKVKCIELEVGEVFFMYMYAIYGRRKTTELCRPVLKYSPVHDRKEVSSKTCSVTGFFTLYYLFDSTRRFSIYSPWCLCTNGLFNLSEIYTILETLRTAFSPPQTLKESNKVCVWFTGGFFIAHYRVCVCNIRPNMLKIC